MNAFYQKSISIVAGCLLFGSASFAQLKTPAPSPQQSFKQDFALSTISVEYSRPSAKGRNIYGGLVPMNKIWRTGANASTKVTFGEDVSVNGRPLKAGTYALYTEPKGEQWDIMFYSDLSLGGNVGNYNKANEVLRTTVPFQKVNDAVETFTIQLANMTDNSADLQLLWAQGKVNIPIKADVDSRIMKSIEQNVINDGRPYYQAASYYYNNGKDLKQALAWADKAHQQNPNAYWVLALKSRIQLKMNDKKGAAATANSIIKMGENSKNSDIVEIGNDLLNQAK